MNVDAKPLAELSRLERCLKPEGIPFTIPKHHILSYRCADDSPTTVVLQTGIVAVHRQSDELLIGIATAPFIFGLTSDMLGNPSEYNIVARTPCSGFYLPAIKNYQRIDEENIWQDAFTWILWINRLLQRRDMQLVGNNSYAQIRAMLLNMATWDDNLRSKIGVMNHIQRSTRISRSVVAEVLAALREGNYISMSRGKLVSVNRLPAEY
ncbi:helix-turn-helix domain-containing protein [Enterobacter sp. ECC-175]|uniref:helix-turn-helix domain-containing protein n=1 Tax=unclassified Enterobacter TaxID=2608935 RepID=UPI000D477114|nr:helix-turn-helix domain-containing protein [Enterobacter sp. RIT 418]RAU35790.1 transcriptional regulator [Enterobacter sp. RIT 418]